jgi:hypothetical protein
MSVYESFKTYSGLSFFQDYVLPNTTRTRNTWYKTDPKIQSDAKEVSLTPKSMENASLNERLKKRAEQVNLAIIFHCMRFVVVPYAATFAVSLALCLPQTPVYAISVTVLASIFSLFNGYCLLNDFDIRWRVHSVLSRREKKNEDKGKATP